MVETRRSKKESAKQNKKSVKKMVKEIEKKEEKEQQQPPAPVKKQRKPNKWAVFLKSEYQTRRKADPAVKFSAVMADPETKLKYQKMKGM